MSTATARRERLVAVSDLTAATIQAAARDLQVIVVTDGDGMPLGRFTPAAVLVEERKDYFLHYPHDPMECLYSCWRHPRPEQASRPSARRPAVQATH